MSGPDPAVAALRLAVRHALPLLPDGSGGSWSPQVRTAGCVLVACSGGADSLALLAATVFETRRADVRVIGVVVDHGLQRDSAGHTARVVEQMATLGADETTSIRVSVDPTPGGIEAGARQARYAALSRSAEDFSADAVLLGHTRDDQAETVLLGLARGSGGRSLSGMPRAFFMADDVVTGSSRNRSPLFLRPLLDLTRAHTEAACSAEDIAWWTDPHNSDPRFLRARVRHTVLPLLEHELGPGVAGALARTAALFRDDVTALDDLARQELERVRRGNGLDTGALETLPSALKTRIIRSSSLDAGAIAAELTRDHVLAVAEIAEGLDRGKQIQLPGHVTAYREGDLLLFRRTGPS